MNKIILIKTFLILAIFAVYLVSSNHPSPDNTKQTLVCIKDNCFRAELATTPAERARGLMFREHLDEDKGMLFIFENDGKPSFWMKNTLIPLDIIWIDENKEVVFISKNAQPCKADFCPTITPSKNAKYVLELNANTTDKIGMSVGDNVTGI